MGNYLFTNNASTTLAVAISNTATSVTVASGTGALFPVPNPSVGSHFHATIVKNGAPGTFEIVDVTVAATDTFTITRAQENTTPLNWAVGDFFNLFPTAAGLMSFAQAADLQSQTQNYAVDTGSVSNIYGVTLTPALTSHVVGMPIRFKAAHTNTGNSVFNDGVGQAALVLPNLAGLTAGAIVAGGIYEATWDGTQFQLSRAGYIPISLLPNPGSVVANDVVRYDGSGNVYSNYLSQSSAFGENPFISQVAVNNGSDGFWRHCSLSYFESQLSLSAIGGSVTNAQVPVGAVLQWQTSLTIGWGQISGTKNADQLQGFTATSSPIGNTVGLRDANGYFWAVYFNQSSSNSENPSISQVMVTNGADSFFRKCSLASLEAQMALSSIGGLLNASTQLTGVVPNTHLPNVGSMPGVTIAADPGTVPSGSPGQVFEYY
ncbi:MAG TPA: hypothetical protein VI653_28480 [Steroidobacteraceae bacterium]